MRTILLLLLPLSILSQTFDRKMAIMDSVTKAYTINGKIDFNKRDSVMEIMFPQRHEDLLIGFPKTWDACPGSDSHIYHSYRLQLITPNKVVSGIVQHLIKEKDGDIHIRLLLDSGYSNVLNQINITAQHGCLVLEIICACNVTQQDAITACEGYTNTIPIPEAGQHITVTGDYVLDKEHGWMEIHPVTSLK